MFSERIDQNLTQSLEHVFWMGGSPCAGKSSIARSLVERYGLRYYACDDAFYQHNSIVTPQAQPIFYQVMHLSSEDLWMRPVEQQVRDEIEIYREEFPLILKDLLALPKDRPVLAEGAALMPECIAPLLNDPRRAIWVIPGADFQLHHYSQREWIHNIVKDTSNPQAAFQNWMQRDIRFARFIRQEAEQRGLRVLFVDGSRTIAENTAEVGAHFQPALLAATRSGE